MPGWRQAAVFLLLVLVGLGAWWFRVATGVAFNPPGFLDEAFDTGVALYALLALAAGFAVPRGFYLWGAAVVLSNPVSALALTAWQQSRGADIVRGGAEGWLGYAFVLVMMTLTTVMALTVLSAVGAGLRLFLTRRHGGRWGSPEERHSGEARVR